jgi:hypothetical protein
MIFLILYLAFYTPYYLLYVILFHLTVKSSDIINAGIMVVLILSGSAQSSKADVRRLP